MAYGEFIADAIARGRIVEDGDCLRWTGACVNGHPADSKGLVRRALWVAKHGPIPRENIVRCTCGMRRCLNLDHAHLSTYQKLAKELGAVGVMSGPVRSAKIAATKRSGRQVKLTQEQARAIRESNETGVALATRYKVAGSTISKIRLGLIRRDYEPNPWRGLGT